MLGLLCSCFLSILMHPQSPVSLPLEELLKPLRKRHSRHILHLWYICPRAVDSPPWSPCTHNLVVFEPLMVAVRACAL